MPKQASLEPQWLAARDHEAKGELDAARGIYQAILRDDATQAFAWHRLSALDLRQGRYRDARAAARTGAAVAVQHGRWRALPWLTRQLLGFDDRIEVRERIEAADWDHPLVLSQSAVLAQQSWLADAHETGLRLAERGLQVAPRSHLLHYVRASLLRHLGRTAEATAAFERCIELAPDFAEAHWALAHHQKADPPGARAGRVRAALQAASTADPKNGLARAHLGYALFRELDDAGDVDGAWQALVEAAAVMRRQVRHSPERERATVEALRAAFPVPIPAPGATQEGRTPVFIVGMPRTGTTVLERILGNHGRVAAAGELNTFSACVAEALDRAFPMPPPAALVADAASLDLAAVGADYLQRTASRHGGRSHLLDKNPQNLLNAGFIARALPQARILCLLRNPMDACFSNLKELFPGGDYGYSYDLGELAAHWACFRDLVAHWQAVLPGRFMTVEYEALVADPERVASEAMAFCGLGFEAGCVDITRNTTPVSTASSSQVRRPIHREGVGAWRRYADQLTPLQARLREAGAGLG